MRTKKYMKGGKAAMYDMVKKYMEGGKMGPDDDKLKSLKNKLSIAKDPKTNYGTLKARNEDIAMIQRQIRDLGV
jgi:hypothetical protein